MGNYSSQYESYYSRVANAKRKYNGYGNYPYGSNSRNQKTTKGNYFVRRFVRELIGVFCLLSAIIVCKTVVTPQTAEVYNYSKSIVNYNYDYTYLIGNLKTLRSTNIEDLQQRIQDLIEAAKIKITGGQTIRSKVRDNFTIPISGKITSNFGERTDPITNKEAFHEGIDIDAKDGTEVKAVFDGAVKEFGENESQGKFIRVDHGSGLESLYAHLSAISVEGDSKITKGEVIAKSGNTGKSTAPHLHFELIYMGKSVDPLEYINFDVKQ